MPISAKTTTKSTTTTIKTTIKSTTATTVKPSQIKTLKSTTNKKKSHNKLKHLPKVVKPTLPKVTKSKSKPSQRKKKLPPKAYHKKTYQGKFDYEKTTMYQPILYTINLILFCPFNDTIELLWISVGQAFAKLQAVKVGGLKKNLPLCRNQNKQVLPRFESWTIGSS